MGFSEEVVDLLRSRFGRAIDENIDSDITARPQVLCNLAQDMLGSLIGEKKAGSLLRRIALKYPRLKVEVKNYA